MNRLSIGVQSFDDHVLGILGRAHDAQGAKRAIACARERFENVSVDLMCGIPGQSTESFEDSVKTAIDCGVSHVSVYPLTIEPHTPFDAMVLSGQLAEPDDDVEASSPGLDTSATKWQAMRSPGSSVVTTSRTGPAFLIWVWGAARPA